jgi:hypothetical protein
VVVPFASIYSRGLYQAYLVQRINNSEDISGMDTRRRPLEYTTSVKVIVNIDYG